MTEPASAVRRRLADYAQLAEAVRAMKSGMADIRATADSDDGLVHVVVDGHGHLVELDLDPRVFRTPDATALAATIVKMVATAVEDSRRQATRLAEPIVPDAQPESFQPDLDPLLRLVDNELKG